MQKPIATAAETKEALLTKSKRRTLEVPIRRSFVQMGPQNRPAPGLLAEFVKRHDERGLDLLLLSIGIASAPPHYIELEGDAGIWSLAAAVGLRRSKQGVAAVSKTLSRLEGRGLLTRARNEEGDRVIKLLKEDGSGESYVHPFKSEPREVYFKLPFVYWRQGYDERLNLSSKAVLLISLSLRPWFILPTTQVKRWYGISPDTLERGLDGLMREDLIRRRREYKKAPLAPAGYTEQWRYRLLQPLGLRWSTREAASADKVVETC